jgi:hypothetical protein
LTVVKRPGIFTGLRRFDRYSSNQKIYEVDPLVCPTCHGKMRIISFRENGDVSKEILEHLGIWLIRSRLPR